MTEPDWLACDEPRGMLDYLRGRAGERKLRLFAVACCRRAWELIPSGVARRAVEEAERAADGAVRPGEREELLRALAAEAGSDKNLFAALGDGTERLRSFRDETASLGEMAAWTLDLRWQFPWLVATGAAALRAGVELATELRWGSWSDRWRREQAQAEWLMRKSDELAAQCALIRCLFGNPFQPSPALADAVLAWNDRLVSRLAQTIYDERRWHDLPLLADALLDAGCADDALMQHCRHGGEHARGCFAVDVVLGHGQLGAPAPEPAGEVPA
jgi:hypothetical protein